MKERNDTAGLPEEELSAQDEQALETAETAETAESENDADHDFLEVIDEAVQKAVAEQSDTAGEIAEELAKTSDDGQPALKQESDAGAVMEETREFPTVHGQAKPQKKNEFEVYRMAPDGEWRMVYVHATTRKHDSKERPAIEHPKPAAPTPVPETKPEEQPTKSKRTLSEKLRLAKIIGASAAAAAIVLFGAMSLYVYTYPGILVGVKAGGGKFRLSGKSVEEASDYIENTCKPAILDTTLTITADGKEFPLHVADIAKETDSRKAAEDAYQVGRTGGLLQRVGDGFGALFGRRNVGVSIVTDTDKTVDFVQKIYENVHFDPTEPYWKVNRKTANLVINTGRTGLDFDRTAVKRDIIDRLNRMELKDFTIETVVTQQHKPDPKAIAEDVNCEPQNATVNKETEEVLDSVSGVTVTEGAIKKAIGDCTEQTYTVPVKITKAQMSAKEMEGLLFRDVLGQATTYYDGNDVGRTNNLVLASESCSGVILNPGEVFSYNETVGERTSDRGYSVATVFENGQAIEDYGGGVCQPSSTIYMATLRADLEVIERGPHMFQISYTPISQDAAVAWGSMDYQFVNNTEFPIKIVMEYGGGALTCLIYGTKMDDKTVELYPEVSYTSDYTFATLYKVITVNGESETVQENNSTYLVHSQIQEDYEEQYGSQDEAQYYDDSSTYDDWADYDESVVG